MSKIFWLILAATGKSFLAGLSPVNAPPQNTVACGLIW